jgi:2-oxoglutarate dehydrogenase E1 component
MTPKKLLRPRNINRANEEVLYRECVSSFDDFSKGGFEEVFDDPKVNTKKEIAKITRVLCCTGKIYYELLDKKVADNRDDIAIVRLEQLYPFPKEKVDSIIEKYGDSDWFWVQEEPSNMGAWSYIHAFYRKYDLKLIARKSSASPATGFKKVHVSQQESIIQAAFGSSRNSFTTDSLPSGLKKTKKTKQTNTDNFAKLKGMGKDIIEQLNQEGIKSFRQLAALTSRDVAGLNKKIPNFGEKFKRYDWKTQADVLL